MDKTDLGFRVYAQRKRPRHGQPIDLFSVSMKVGGFGWAERPIKTCNVS